MSDVWDFYMKTLVEVSNGEKTWTIQASDKPVGEWPFEEEGLIILTAANPRSQNLSSTENEKRNKDLKGLF